MTNPQPPSDAWASTGLSRAIRQHSGLFLAEGIILCILGIAAIAVPLLAGLAATIFLGWLFLAAGLAGLYFTLKEKGAPGFGWSLLSAVAAIAAGAILLWHPLKGLLTLTYVLIAFFIVDGAAMIFLAISHRRELTGKWEWVLVNGVIDLILAGIIISGLPGAFTWALGVLVGIDLVFGGAALVALALDARRTAQ
jgi:uncharacterized membrane protein HdeD (DUF308 family)